MLYFAALRTLPPSFGLCLCGFTTVVSALLLCPLTRWGAAVELFILDTRQYRSLSTDEDTARNPKTMLGETQVCTYVERRKADAPQFFLANNCEM